MAKTDKVSAPSRPTIILPPRTSFDSIFAGLSPGPMTLVSSFFSDSYSDSDCPSFSQLLAGAMASPVAADGGIPTLPSFLASSLSNEVDSEDACEQKLGFKQNRPVNLVVAHSPLFMVPPGLSPSGLLNSPGFFSPLQSPFGMTHQQALAQVTAQAALSQCHLHVQAESQPSSLVASEESLNDHQSFASNTTIQQQVPTVISEPESSVIESSEVSQPNRKSLPPCAAVDKPGNDGYNWRKYGQKQVKTSDHPRSYYKCTHPNCPVKKKVERNFDGQITEIIYKGQHNHELPQSNKRAKDGIDKNSNTNSQVRRELGVQGETEMSRENETFHSVPRRVQASTQLTPIQLSGSSDHVEMGDIEMRLNQADNDEPNPKRRQYRNKEVGTSEVTSSHNTVTEPRIVVQTRSEVDLLDDGYKWRKYGQKVVKGNPHPRWSYYKCTYAGCNVRKHVERASTDPKAVVTTYEGKHNHDVPGGRKSGSNTANSNTLQLKSHKVVTKKPALLEEMDFGNKDERPVLLQLKEEQIIA
ncbi:hypothetical protein TEA_025131 [Camellia sinensis var. sinensis]|uniref:WRKY domain-containing protein n=1 Tax=Camellia sinensis var. sinensis TaxID=542762 RepID=A0A4S4DLY9_CAMSN|nr:hypothetical protein TEA_025131 [Camellia sinensis var. sinensis]